MCTYSAPHQQGLLNHIRKHSNEINKDRTNANRQAQNSVPPAPSMPTLDQLMNGTTQQSIDTSPSNTDRISLPPDSAGIAAPPPEAGNEENYNIDGDDEEFLENGRIRNPDAASPSLKYQEEFANINREFDKNKWDLFEDTLRNFVDFAQERVGLKKYNNDVRKARIFNDKDPTQMQRLYRRNRRRAAREVLEIPTAQCPVPQEDLKTNFYPESQGNYDPSIFTSNTSEIEPPDSTSFTPAEVKAKLAKCENTAPGQDRLTYNHLKGVDPDGKTLCQIFNICLKARRIPES